MKTKRIQKKRHQDIENANYNLLKTITPLHQGLIEYRKELSIHINTTNSFFVVRYSFSLILLFLTAIKSFSQGLTIPGEYSTFIQKADSLLEEKNYDEASIVYRKAFLSFGWRGLPDDRYNAARTFGLMRQYDSARVSLKNLCAVNRYWNYRKVETDPAFSKLRLTKEWNDLMDCMKGNKEKYAKAVNIDWYNFLDTVAFDDQRYRNQLLKMQSGSQYDTILYRTLSNKMKEADSINRIKVISFIEKNGWQSSNVVGYSGNSALFLVIQHSEIDLQEKFLPIIKDAAEKQMVRFSSLALLEDRISVSRNGYQIYGSQLEWDPVTGKYSLFPIKDEAEVNHRRKKMGLETLEDYAKQFGITYTPVK